MHPPQLPPALFRSTWLLPDEVATAALARALAAQPALRDALVTLQGDLGAGKTTLVRHWLHALGVTGRVKSPTYTLVESYEPQGLPVWHADFYRFQDPAEWDDAGLRDVFAQPGLKLVEWPERVQGLLPAPDLQLRLTLAQEPQRWLAAQTSRADLGAALTAVTALCPCSWSAPAVDEPQS